MNHELNCDVLDPDPAVSMSKPCNCGVEAKAIDEAHPINSGRDDLYRDAMRLVGTRHDKGDFVELITWLLLRSETAEKSAKDYAEGSASLAEQYGKAQDRIKVLEEAVEGELDLCMVSVDCIKPAMFLAEAPRYFADEVGVCKECEATVKDKRHEDGRKVGELVYTHWRSHDDNMDRLRVLGRLPPAPKALGEAALADILQADEPARKLPPPEAMHGAADGHGGSDF